MIPENNFYPWALRLATQRALLQHFGQSAESFATRPLMKKQDRFEATRYDDMREGAQLGMAAVHTLLSPVRRGGHWLLNPASAAAAPGAGIHARDTGIVPYAGLATANALGASIGAAHLGYFTAVAAVMLYGPVELLRNLMEVCYIGPMGLGAAVGAIVGTFFHALTGPRSLLPKAAPRPGPHDDTYPSFGAGGKPGLGRSSWNACETWVDVPALPATRLGMMAIPPSLASHKRLLRSSAHLRDLLSPGCDRSASLATGIASTNAPRTDAVGVLIDKHRIYVAREPESPACILVDRYGAVHRCAAGMNQVYVTSRVNYLLMLSPLAARMLSDHAISDRLLRNSKDPLLYVAGQLGELVTALSGRPNDDDDIAVTVFEVDQALAKPDLAKQRNMNPWTE